jgi:hypothetical protein
MFLRLRGAHTSFSHAYVQREMAFLLYLGRCTPYFESLVITSTLNLHASLMDIHHDTSLRSIFKDDSIFLTSRTCIHSCSGKGAGLWLVARSSICSFFIAHSTFTLELHFCFNLIQPFASNLFTCECEHGLDAFGTHLAHCLFGGQQITTHDAIRNVMYAFIRKNGHIVWRE